MKEINGQRSRRMCELTWSHAAIVSANVFCPFDSFTVFLALLLGGTLLQRIVSQ